MHANIRTFDQITVDTNFHLFGNYRQNPYSGFYIFARAHFANSEQKMHTLLYVVKRDRYITMMKGQR